MLIYQWSMSPRQCRFPLKRLPHGIPLLQWNYLYRRFTCWKMSCSFLKRQNFGNLSWSKFEYCNIRSNIHRILVLTMYYWESNTCHKSSEYVSNTRICIFLIICALNKKKIFYSYSKVWIVAFILHVEDSCVDSSLHARYLCQWVREMAFLRCFQKWGL